MAPERVRRRSGRPTASEAAALDRDVREAALARFLEHGYDGTSMATVARAAGTTKASLYARWPTKEALFAAVLAWAVARPDWPFPEPPPPDTEDLATALHSIAAAACRRATDPAMVALSRIAIAEADRVPDLARRAQGNSTWARRETVVALLERHAATGEIVADDPGLLAEHFVAMVAGMPARLAAFGIERTPDEQERRTRAAVELFLRALRP